MTELPAQLAGIAVPLPKQPVKLPREMPSAPMEAICTKEAIQPGARGQQQSETVQTTAPFTLE